MQDTIVAIATPPGRGGVGILRLSGAKAYAIARQLNGDKVLEPRVAVFCSFYKQSQEQSNLIDQGIMLYFQSPASFTGEDVVEIQAHGSPITLDILMQECIYWGARIARPGEFSERAFLNDKMDLIQAEAIADLIQASSETAANMAMRSLQGDFSKAVDQINEQIVHLRLYVEAAIDFPEEEIDFLSDGKIAKDLSALIDSIAKLQLQANQGLIMREGLSLVIAGRPNAGKSTLLNCLAGKEVAIVTEVAGTTRDLLTSAILLDDIPLHIIDTAGLRDSEDRVEKEGIKRTWQEVQKADCILLVIDVNTSEEETADLLQEVTKDLSNTIPVISVFNKIDTQSLDPSHAEDTVYLSAKDGIGIEGLKHCIKQKIGYQPSEGRFLARRRHLDALDRAKALLLTGERELIQHKALELLAEDLRLAHQSLCAITGEFTSDDLLGEIFSSFCIGK